MSRCDITIEFDRANRTYLGGETVSGEVHVMVNKDTTSDGIVLENMWKTHGYGNPDLAVLEIQDLAGGSPAENCYFFRKKKHE